MSYKKLRSITIDRQLVNMHRSGAERHNFALGELKAILKDAPLNEVPEGRDLRITVSLVDRVPFPKNLKL